MRETDLICTLIVSVLVAVFIYLFCEISPPTCLMLRRLLLRGERKTLATGIVSIAFRGKEATEVSVRL